MPELPDRLKTALAVQTDEDGVSTSLIDTEFNETSPTLSPDGRLIAYASSATGRPEVYVHPFPDVNVDRWPVSSNGGREPTWSPTGEELFYVNAENNLVAVRLDRSTDS